MSTPRPQGQALPSADPSGPATGPADALQTALAAWEAAGRPDDGVPAATPADVLPLLQAACLLDAQRPRPDPEFRRRLGQALALEARRRDEARRRRPDPLRTAFAWPIAWRPALRGGLILLALVLGLGAVTVAQAARDPQGWAGRLLRSTRDLAHEALPGLGLSADPLRRTTALPAPTPSATAPRPGGAGERAVPGQGAPAEAGSAMRPQPSPEVFLGRKPGRSQGLPAVAGDGERGSGNPAPAPATPPADAAAPTPALAWGRDRLSLTSTALAPPSATPTATAPRAPSPSPTAAAAAQIGRGPVPVGAAFSGRVDLGEGRPLRDLPIFAYRLDAGGKLRWWDPAATTRTDAEGRYWLGGLAPGSYKLMAGYLFPLAPRRWYPAADRSADAEPIHLDAGQSLEDLNLRFADAAAAPLSFWARIDRR